MMNPLRSYLPDSLRGMLREFADKTLLGTPIANIEPILQEIDALPLTTLGHASREIAMCAKLGWSRNTAMSSSQAATRADLAPLFIFHPNGFVREAALKWISGPARSAAQVLAIAHRLNDWVGPVRLAAEACAARVFPPTPAETLLPALAVLLGRIDSWQRWSSIPAILLETLTRQDVVAGLAAMIRDTSTGKAARLLRSALRSPLMDAHLTELSQYALQPIVRAIALRALLQGRARWCVGTERKWIDKSMGCFRQVPAFAERRIDQPRDVQALFLMGIEDTSPIVRRVALDRLLVSPPDITIDQTLIDQLAADRSRSVRERIAFLKTSIGQV